MPLLVEGKTNMHTDFWESSWQRIDEKRLMEYAERKEQTDPINAEEQKGADRL